jgi:hypothetical protein
MFNLILQIILVQTSIIKFITVCVFLCEKKINVFFSLRTYESPQSWNDIRFANSEYEEDLSSLDYTVNDQSLLHYVLISETNDYQPAIERLHIEHSIDVKLAPWS